MITGVKQLEESLRCLKQPIIGIGNTAFLRAGPAFIVPKFEIICIQETTDVPAIRRVCLVTTIEGNIGGEMPAKKNASSILSLPLVQKLLKGRLADFGLLVYKSTAKIEKVVAELGGKLLANPSFIRDPFEDKKEFRVLAKEAGLPILPGENIALKELDKEKLKQLQQKYGQKLVFQLTDIKVGGGIGTIFVESREQLVWLEHFVAGQKAKGKELKRVNITPLVTGLAGSITGVVTREGVLAGPLQLQLVDVPQVTAFHGRSGVWCGHDWLPERFNLKLQHQAEDLLQTLGKFMAKKGYKGIFGLDVVVGKNEIYPIECNARYTGTFPVYSMLQLEAGEPSFDVFQLAEFLDLDYSFAIDKVQGQWRQSKVGAQLIFHNQTRRWIKIGGQVRAGVYRWHDGKIEWLREGFATHDIYKPENEFVLTDGVPKQGTVYKPADRLGRILFKRSIAPAHNRINEETAQIVKAIIAQLGLEAIPNPQL